MNTHRKLTQTGLEQIREAIKTNHGRMILAGLTVGLCYLPIWLGGLITRASQGSAGLPLITAVVFIALRYLWKQRHQLAKQVASEEDRLLGHIMILSGVVLFPFCRFAVWPQAAIWLLVLAGIACSSWGADVFIRHPLPSLLIPLSVYPKPGAMAREIWRAITPHKFLEEIMASWGAGALRLLGQPATPYGSVVSLPAGAVDVDWSCNGFNMAFAMAAAGLIMGLFLKQSFWKTIALMAIGIVLALVFNVPRIMLLAMASVYWGKDSFNFWHGPIGGQIFSGVLFTVYYYAVMWLANRGTKPQTS